MNIVYHHIFFCIKVAIACCVAVLPPAPANATDTADQFKAAPIVNFHTVVPQQIFRGGQPDSELGWQFLKSMGIKTVIKLNQYSFLENNVEQEKLEAKKYGIQLIPVLMQPEDWPHNWNLGNRPSRESLDQAAKTLEDHANWPVFVHCSHGKDRTGLVIALYRVTHDHYCKDKAYAEMMSYGHSSYLCGLRQLLYSDAVKEQADCVR